MRPPPGWVSSTVLLLALGTGGCHRGTYVSVEVRGGGLMATSLDVTVTSAGHTTQRSLDNGGEAFSFPQTFYLSFVEGRSGKVDVDVVAKASGTEVARAHGMVELMPGETVELKVSLGLEPVDMAPRPPVTFAEPKSFPTAGNPLSLTIGDLDGNPQPDIVVACEGGHVVSTLLNSGDGAFGQHVDYLAGGIQPTDPHVADFDGDGLPDVVSALNKSDALAIHWGVGKGALSQAKVYTLPMGAFPLSTGIGDYNGDGRWDVATNDLSIRGITVYLNQGSRAFRAVQVPDVGGRMLAARDLNLDGRMDLFLSGSLTSVGLLIADAVADFKPLILLPAIERSAGDLVLSDWNRDGRVDVVVGGPGGRSHLFSGKSTLDFHDPVAVTGVNNGNVVGGHFNGDSQLDLAYVVLDEGVDVVLARDNGAFSEPIRVLAGAKAPGITAGDLNGDGLAELVVTYYMESTVLVLLNTTR